MEDKAHSRQAYETFLSSWKDADPDIPILKQAKTEHATLQEFVDEEPAPIGPNRLVAATRSFALPRRMKKPAERGSGCGLLADGENSE